jgi:hypothetical protein
MVLVGKHGKGTLDTRDMGRMASSEVICQFCWIEAMYVEGSMSVDDSDVLGEFAAFVEDMFAAFLVVLVLCDGTGMAMFAACGDGGECD